MADVGTAWVAIKPAVKGFASALTKQTTGEVDTAGKGIGSKFGTALKIGVAGAVTAGVAATGVFMKKSIDAAAEAKKTAALTAAVIKSTGGVANVTAEEVEKQAESLAELTGQSKETIQSGENMLLTFRNVRNEAGKGNDIFNQATTAITDMSAALGKDPKAAALQLGKALNDPVKGMTALSRSGIQFTDTQKKVITGFVDQGKTAQAQKVILKEVSKEFGGAAESQATSGAKLKVAMTQLEVTVGTALLPVIGALKTGLMYLVMWINSRVVPAFSALGGWITPITDSFKAWLQVLFSAQGEAGGIGKSVDSLSSSIGANLVPVLQALAQTFTTVILPALMQLGQYLASNLVPIFNAVASIVAHQILPIYRIFYTFIVAQLIPAVMSIVKSVASSLKPAFDQLFQSLKGLMPSINQLLAKLKQYLPVVLKVVLFILKLVGVLLKVVAVILGRVLPVVIRLAAFLIKVLVKAIIAAVIVIGTIIRVLITVAKWFAAAGRAVGDFAKKVAEGITRAVKFVLDLDQKVRNAVSGFGTLLLHAGEQLIDGLIQGITNKLSALGNKMKEVANKVKGFLPGSPVKEGPLTAWNRKSPGATLVERIAEGLGQTGSVDAAMTALANRAQLHAGVSLAGAGAASGNGGLGGGKLRLVVDGYEFNAYVDARADDRVSSSNDLDDQRGRAAWQ
jgi:phage-related protein